MQIPFRSGPVLSKIPKIVANDKNPQELFRLPTTSIRTRDKYTRRNLFFHSNVLFGYRTHNDVRVIRVSDTKQCATNEK